MRAFQAAWVASLAACTVLFVAAAWRWPLVGDAALLHYIAFLGQHGFRPYRDIPDLNLPGALLPHVLALRWFGLSSLVWRLYDFGLLAVITGACFALCRQRRAALFAAGLFALLHGRDGLLELGQRDLLLTALLAWGCVFLLRGERRSLLAGLTLGAACMVKPVALLPLVLLPVIAREHVRRMEAVALGAMVPITAMMVYLKSRHTFPAFLDLELHLAPYHASLFRLPAWRLAGQTVSSVLLPIAGVCVVFLVQGKRWRSLRDRLLLAGFFCGSVSFWVQGRGYPYHRYPSQLFLLLLAAEMFTEAKERMQTMLTSAALAYGSFVVAPKSLLQVWRFTPQRDPLRQALSADLLALGGPALGGRVQCLDMAGGCVTTLLHAQLVQATGFLYDCYLYPAHPTSAAERDRYRSAFAEAWTRARPELVIATSDECGPPDADYRKLTRWPWLAGTLASQYTLVREYRPAVLQSWGGKPALPYGYRIYRRKAPETIPPCLPPTACFSELTSAPPTARSR